MLQIYRIKRVDGTEWLKSRGRLVGLDKAGNEVEHSFVDPELYYKPLTRHELKRKEPQNENSPLERVYVEAGINSQPGRFLDMVEGRFRIEDIIRVNRKNDEHTISNKIFDFSVETIKVLFEQGYNDALEEVKEYIESKKEHLTA